MVNDPFSWKYNIIFKQILKLSTKFVLKQSYAISFVTINYLQNRYFKYFKGNYFTELPASKVSEKIFQEKKTFSTKIINIIHVSNHMNNFDKGHKELIYFAKSLIDQNFKQFHISLVGDGYLRKYFETLVSKLNLKSYFTFIGLVNPEKLDYLYSINDFMIYPSYTEGMPRVLIEALSHGLIVLSTNVGGVFDLLDQKFLINLNPKKISIKFQEIINLDLNKISQNNKVLVSRYEEKHVLSLFYNFYRKIFQKINN
jgi:glycosyltransferase involved in cell wall biosynthesis